MAQPKWATVSAPAQGMWRVGQSPDPLRVNKHYPPQIHFGEENRAGNRFDSPNESYHVLYLATKKLGAYGETLARYRPVPDLKSVVKDDWHNDGRMEIGCLPSDWRHQRAVARAGPLDEVKFLDVESRKTRDFITDRAGSILSFFGIDRPIDVSDIRGRDYTLTRVVSLWAHQQRSDSEEPRFAGIRYLSRIDTDWECWAVFERTPMDLEEILPIEANDPDLLRICSDWNLKVF